MEYPAAAAGSGGHKYYYPPQHQHSQPQAVRRPPRPAARWVKQWIPQDLASSGGKCSLFKWVREDGYRNSKENPRVLDVEAPKPEPTTEILFLCSYDNCGKTFVDVGALRKHAHVHNEKQYICNEPNCGKKFVDSSKLKRHYLTHTGQKDFVCPHPGCGKAFSLDFNLRSHLKTHASENYHICPFPACGKRFTSDFKLAAHVKSHEKIGTPIAVQHAPAPAPAAEKPHVAPKPLTPATTSYIHRPFVCPYEGCDKAYIHGYKLNLHLKTQHPEHGQEENGKVGASAGQHAGNEQTYQYNYAEVGEIASNPKRSKHKVHSSKAYNAKVSRAMPSDTSGVRNQWPGKATYQDDSEETEEDGGNNLEDGWRYGNNDDDEETPDED